MTRCLPIVFAVLPAIVSAAPALKPKAEFYYPTRVGDTRVYESKGAKGKATEYTNVVTEVTTKDGVMRVSVGMVEGETTSLWSVVDVSETSIVRHTAAGSEVDPPETVLKLPFKAGESWKWTSKAKDGAIAVPHTYTVVTEEEIEVPAGKFRAIRIDEEWQTLQRKTRRSHWHAAGIGVIKQATMDDGKEIGAPYVLKTFKPGK